MHSVGLALYTAGSHLEAAQLSQQNILLERTTADLAGDFPLAILQKFCADSRMQWLACSIGPGSFTGIRIGLAIAKSLALINNIPLIGLDSLSILAQLAPKEEPQLNLSLKLTHKDFYTAQFKLSADGYYRRNSDIQRSSNASKQSALTFDSNGRGYATEHLLDDAACPQLDSVSPLVDGSPAQALAQLARECYERQDFDPLHDVQALYLKAEVS